MQKSFLFANYYEIIHIPDVEPDAQFILYKMVKFIQIDIGEKLGCQSPDRKPRIGEAVLEDDLFAEVKHIDIAQCPCDLPQQNPMPDVWEVAPDVGFEGIRAMPVCACGYNEAAESFAGLVRPLVFSTGKAVRDKPSLKEWFDDFYKGAVNNAVCECGRLDEPELGFSNHKFPARRGEPRPVYQGALNFEKVVFEASVKLKYLIIISFSTARSLPCGVEVAEVHYLRP